MQPPIGLIGVGLLGTAIAERLLQAGFPVVGFDASELQRARLVDLGGRACQTAIDVIIACRRSFLSLPTSSVVKSVLTELDPHLRSGDILLDTTTGSAVDSETFGQQLAAKEVCYLDATVAGSSEQLRQGQAVFMVGGNQQVVNQCHDLWNALTVDAKMKVFFLGPCGSGARIKLIVNLVLGLNRAVLAEGLTLARRSGIDPQKALEVLKAGPAFSAAMETKGPKMIANDFEPQARLAQHHKDVQLILELARASDTELPLSTVHEQILQKAIALGFGDQDNSAIIKAFEKP